MMEVHMFGFFKILDYMYKKRIAQYKKDTEFLEELLRYFDPPDKIKKKYRDIYTEIDIRNPKRMSDLFRAKAASHILPDTDRAFESVHTLLNTLRTLVPRKYTSRLQGQVSDATYANLRRRLFLEELFLIHQQLALSDDEFEKLKREEEKKRRDEEERRIRTREESMLNVIMGACSAG